MGNRSTSETSSQDTDSTPRELKLSDGSSYTGETLSSFFGRAVPHGKGVAKAYEYTLTGTWNKGLFQGEKAEYEIRNLSEGSSGTPVLQSSVLTVTRIVQDVPNPRIRTPLVVSDVSLPGVKRMYGLFLNFSDTPFKLWAGVKEDATLHVFRGVCVFENGEVYAGRMSYKDGSYLYGGKGIYITGKKELSIKGGNVGSTLNRNKLKGSLSANVTYDTSEYDFTDSYSREVCSSQGGDESNTRSGERVGHVEGSAEFKQEFFRLKMPEIIENVKMGPAVLKYTFPGAEYIGVYKYVIYWIDDKGNKTLIHTVEPEIEA